MLSVNTAYVFLVCLSEFQNITVYVKIYVVPVLLPFDSTVCVFCILEMGSIPVLVKHSGRWTYEKKFEEYVTNVIPLSTSATFVDLHDFLASHLSVDLTRKRILVEYQITGNAGQIQIHNVCVVEKVTSKIIYIKC